jgi:hypothetical protein
MKTIDAICVSCGQPIRGTGKTQDEAVQDLHIKSQAHEIKCKNENAYPVKLTAFIQEPVDELQFCDDDIRQVFQDENKTYIMGMPLMAQLIKLLRQLLEKQAE